MVELVARQKLTERLVEQHRLDRWQQHPEGEVEKQTEQEESLLIVRAGQGAERGAVDLR